MQAKSKEQKKMERDLKKIMTGVGTYNPSFDMAISYTAKLILEHKKVQTQFENSGGMVVISHTNKLGHKNLIKNPLYQAIEQMRGDILSYLRDLGLTPTGLKKINQNSFNEVQNDSPLAEVLKRLM